MKGYRHVHSFTSCGERTMSSDRSDERQPVKTDNSRRNVCWLCGLLVLVLLIVVLVTLLVCQFTTGSCTCQRRSKLHREELESQIERFCIAADSSVCYADLGCITSNASWCNLLYRPVNLKPSDRSVVNTTFVLRTRETLTVTDKFV
jgi:hypothetical protein